MTALPPFDVTRRCVKCQTLTVASVEYRADIPMLPWAGDDLVLMTTTSNQRGTRGECILRHCRDCGWAWPEACADACAEAGTLDVGRDAPT